jgi:hypothetical protein
LGFKIFGFKNKIEKVRTPRRESSIFLFIIRIVSRLKVFPPHHHHHHGVYSSVIVWPRFLTPLSFFYPFTCKPINIWINNKQYFTFQMFFGPSNIHRFRSSFTLICWGKFNFYFSIFLLINSRLNIFDYPQPKNPHKEDSFSFDQRKMMAQKRKKRKFFFFHLDRLIKYSWGEKSFVLSSPKPLKKMTNQKRNNRQF